MEQEITLVVSSCDKYEDAWYPYFALIEKYWPQHPERICLITETKSFAYPGMQIKCCNYDKKLTWSERLYKTLEGIDTKYVIFSLEDFFLLDFVKQERIEECVGWMEENPNIAVCRFFASHNQKLKPTEKYKDFRLADKSVAFRLDTQMALWNRETLMSFIDLKESPWQFEEWGTQRVLDTEKLFLWYYSEDLSKRENEVICYRLLFDGYGISWGHWLWNNKAWFRKNGINNVNYRIGTLSERTVNLRRKYLYPKTKQPLLVRIIKPFWRMILNLRRTKADWAVIGFKESAKASLAKLCAKVKRIPGKFKKNKK